jgi:hypothetical protein
VQVQGEVFWALNPDRITSRKLLDEFLVQWDKSGYKIGLQIPTGQTIERLEYGGVALQSVDTQGLAQAYGTLSGFTWVAWGSRDRQRTLGKTYGLNVVVFPVNMTITPRVQGPLTIQVASRHFEGSFAQSFPGVWAIK